MAKRMLLWIVIISLCLLPGCGGGEAPQSTASVPLEVRLDEFFAADEGFHGTVLVAVGGQVLLCKGYGMADNARGTICTPSTVYPIGSMTKQFTALAILQLCQRGKLSLTDPLSKYLPGLITAVGYVSLVKGQTVKMEAPVATCFWSSK